MSADQDPEVDPKLFNRRSDYQSALFGEHSTVGFDLSSEMTQYLGEETEAAPHDFGHTQPRPASMAPVHDPPPSPNSSPMVPGLAPNQMFAEHRLIRFVTSDRLGDLWLAFDSELQCRRAIKVLRPEVADEPRAVEAFFRAVRAQAQLKHSNIVQIVRVGRHEGIPYHISEWVDGSTLSTWLGHEGSLPVSIAWDVLRQVLVGLNHAFTEGLLHHDLNPLNILVVPAEKSGEARRLHVRLMNFGMSGVLDRVLETASGRSDGAAHGSRAEYVAPEMVTGMRVDFHADIYSAGILLYHMLVGFPPFRGGTRGEILFKQVHDPMPALPPMVREGLGPPGLAILRRMTEKLPVQRFPSYQELLEAVFAAPLLGDRRRAGSDRGASYLEVAPGKKAQSKGSSRGLLNLAGLLVAAGAIAAGVYGYKMWQKSHAVISPREEAAASRPAVAVSSPPPAAAPIASAPSLPPREQLPQDSASAMPSVAAAAPVSAIQPGSNASAPSFVDGELILDDAMPGALKLDPQSAWVSTSAAGSYKDNSLLAAADGTHKTATFIASIPEEGEYDVSLWWTPGDVASRSSKVICTIYTTTGPFRGTLDQTGPPGAGAFFPIGHYTLPAGRRVSVVTVSTDAIPPSPSTMVSVDALRLKKVGATAVALPASAPVSASMESAPPPPAATSAAGPDDKLIIESGGGMNSTHYKEISGKWIDSRTPPDATKSIASGLSPRGKFGTRKSIFTSAGQDTPAAEPAIARYSPQFDSPGHYYVYVTWPRGGNATPVNYVVHHAGGEAEKSYPQDGYGFRAGAAAADSWILVGDYDFNPGPDQYVEVQLLPGAHASQTRVSGQVYADSVCFSKSPLPDAKIVNTSSTDATGELPSSTSSSSPSPGDMAPLTGKPI